MFTYPVGVQLFNRPAYAKRVLASISEQSLPVDQNKLFIFIDGFKGSIYQSRGSVDKTDEVESIAREFFPHATVVRYEENCGIADLHNKLQESTFSGSDQWAAFFEEDVVLDKSYLEELSELIDIVDDCDKVVKVACFQILPSLSHLPRGYNGFYPGHGTKAFAERKSFFLAHQFILEEFVFLERLTDISKPFQSIKSSMVKDSFRIASLAGANALGTVICSFNKDLALDSFLHAQGKIHIVTKPNLATDIGIEGIHNYTTPILKVSKSDVRDRQDLLGRRSEFIQALPVLIQESDQYITDNYKVILDGYYTSLSGWAMLQKILKKSFNRVPLINRIVGIK